jgi:hypothetical protein
MENENATIFIGGLWVTPEGDSDRTFGSIQGFSIAKLHFLFNQTIKRQ